MNPTRLSFRARHLVSWRRLLWAVGGAATLQLGCIASETPADDAEFVTGAKGCVEVTTHAGYPNRTYYRRRTWDRAARILTEEGSSSRTFTEVGTLKWRYTTDGRILAYIGVEQPFQHDYVYDDHDNVSEFRLSYPAKPDLMTPSTADTWIGTRYGNEYGADGRLTASTMSHFGSSASGGSRSMFFEDGAGRCERIEKTFVSAEPSTETRLYDEAGRVKHVEAAQQGALVDHTDSTYDDQGRIQTYTFVLEPRTGFARGMVSTTYDYLPDGTQTITRDDTLTDVADDLHVVTRRSAACQAIDAEIGKPADQRCRVVEFK